MLVEIIKTLDGREDGSGTRAEAVAHTREALLPLMAAHGVIPDAESLERLADKFARTPFRWVAALVTISTRSRSGAPGAAGVATTRAGRRCCTGRLV